MTRRLTIEEIKKCLKAWKELNDQQALELLVLSHQGLVIFFVKRYLNKGLTFEELKSAGNEGLLRAINKFDYNNSSIESFGTYISVAIENDIKLELKKYNKHSQVLSFEQPIGQNKDGTEMRIEDLIGTEADELVDEIIKGIKNNIVREALESLTSREKQIIILRYGLDDNNEKTLQEIAEIMNCSSKTIAYQEQKALRKMKYPRNKIKLDDFIE